MYNKTLKEYSELLASNKPIPGGGGTSALVGNLASSLSLMAINLTYGKKKYAEYEQELNEIEKELKELNEKLLKYINDDAKAFYPLSKAYSMDKHNPDYFDIIEKCLQDAVMPPLQIVRKCCRVIEINARLKDISSKLVVSDVATSTMLAYGALKGAYANVLVNTSLMNNKEYARNIENEAKGLMDKYAFLAIQTYDYILGRL